MHALAEDRPLLLRRLPSQGMHCRVDRHDLDRDEDQDGDGNNSCRRHRQATREGDPNHLVTGCEDMSAPASLAAGGA